MDLTDVMLDQAQAMAQVWQLAYLQKGLSLFATMPSSAYEHFHL